MISVNVAQLSAAAPNGDPKVIKAIADNSGTVFSKYAINSKSRVLGFLSTAYEESGGFRKLTEDLNYTAARLVEVWPTRFPTISSAIPYSNNPKALADRVYNGRMGNTGPDDGWFFRGRGLIQITGKDNFTLLQKLTGLPLVAQPELVADPNHLLECAVAMFTQFKGILGYCDSSDFMKVWALVGTGRADGRVINPQNHQDALTRLSKAITVLADTPPPVVTPPKPVTPPPPDVPVNKPLPVPIPISRWSRLWSWLTGLFRSRTV